jgi:hypothetical protein
MIRAGLVLAAFAAAMLLCPMFLSKLFRGKVLVSAVALYILRVVSLVVFFFAHHYVLAYAVAPAVGGAVRRGEPLWHAPSEYWKTSEGVWRGRLIRVLGFPLVRLDAVELSKQQAVEVDPDAGYNRNSGPWARFYRWDILLNGVLWAVALVAFIEFFLRRMIGFIRTRFVSLRSFVR